jgi:hypothetical protein
MELIENIVEIIVIGLFETKLQQKKINISRGYWKWIRYSWEKASKQWLITIEYMGPEHNADRISSAVNGYFVGALDTQEYTIDTTEMLVVANIELK